MVGSNSRGAAVLVALLSTAFAIFTAQLHRMWQPVLQPVYGHIHIGKTAGTSLNGLLAARFENVCGHKGYSYDYWQANERVKGDVDANGVWHRSQTDSYAMLFPDFERTRVPHQIMEEIGFENCDYVSHEIGAGFWLHHFRNWHFPIELHVPCRDPASHLMSQCNHNRVKFNCNSADLAAEVRKCGVAELVRADNQSAWNRFHPQLTQLFSTKCFSALNVDEYVEYMSRKLREKRLPAQYVYRGTNSPRNPGAECIWTNQTVKEFVEKYMIENIDYHGFCASCINSADDLLRQQSGWSRLNVFLSSR